MKVHAYLTIKKRIDPSFAATTIVPVTSATADLETLVDDIVDFALVSDDLVPIALERGAQSDIAKPDFDPTLECNSDCDHGHSTSNLQQDFEATKADSELPTIPMEHILITRRPESNLPNNVDILRAFRDQTTEQGDVLPLVVADVPINEFRRNDTFFLGSFSHLFLLGEGVHRTRGAFNKREIQLLLLQHDNRFAHCSSFVFAAFNQMQRHDAIGQVSMRVKNNHYAMTVFDELVNDPAFSERINVAIANPESNAAKELCSKVMDITRITGSKVTYSEMERRSELSKMLALMHYAGPFSFFVTVAPADLESRLIMRLSRRRSNQRLSNASHLCVEDDDIVLSTDILPSLAQRRTVLAKNPVAAGVVYKKLAECMLEHLVGLQASYTTRSNAPCMNERKQGAFGKPVCFAGVNEVRMFLK